MPIPFPCTTPLAPSFGIGGLLVFSMAGFMRTRRLLLLAIIHLSQVELAATVLDH